MNWEMSSMNWLGRVASYLSTESRQAVNAQMVGH